MSKTVKQVYTDARSDNDLAFCWLILGGWAAADAFLYVYNSNATRASAAVLATNKLKEPHINNTLLRLANAWYYGELTYSSKHTNPLGRR